MSKRAKLENVAEKAGVSLATASQVMRGTGRISEKTRKKVLKAASDLHYVRDGRAAAMRSGANLEVGFVINKIANPFNAEVISGVSDKLGAEGYLVSILDGRDDLVQQTRHLQSFIELGRAGLLWVPASDQAQSTLEMLKANRTPTVTFMRALEGATFDHVGVQNADAVQKATEHLIDLGHRDIAYLGGQSQSSVRRDRVSGYQRTLSSHDLEFAVVWDCEDTKLAGLQAIEALLAAHPNTTAIVCNGDMVAIGACLGAARMGLKIGHDLSVVGFDDIVDAQLATPALTTMNVSPYNLGQKLADVLLNRIRNPEDLPTTAEVAAQLVVRETTGKPRTSEPS